MNTSINSDFRSLLQYRTDGRKKQQHRKFTAQFGIQNSANGSVYLKQGLTQLYSYGYIKQFQKQNLQINYKQCQFRQFDNKDSKKYKKQLQSFIQNIKTSFLENILMEFYQRSTIQLHISLINNDGSIKSAIINIITLTLLNCGIYMKELIVSNTIGFMNNNYFADLTYQQHKYVNAQLILSYIPNKKKIDFIELNSNMIKFGQQSCQLVYKKIRQIITDYGFKCIAIYN